MSCFVTISAQRKSVKRLNVSNMLRVGGLINMKTEGKKCSQLDHVRLLTIVCNALQEKSEER